MWKNLRKAAEKRAVKFEREKQKEEKGVKKKSKAVVSG
jgi:hypothetical protein